MGVDLQAIALLAGPGFDSRLNIGVADALSTLADEQGVCINLCAVRRGVVADFQPVLERSLGIAADR